ncbi:longevity assurance proteins LAG1/LAC1 [Aaosphaeria arxii CBS 175.79]|uniref:Longevity assurance proteins LAG1/LAC1 n=1 Tax=Aaosphaeria arxii CBS 175.79 TaxID=1450172 RepID=A0A6A5XS23_9PLEO|nr:longevity assurance proteins LAG1/LAC1 [Aaosphaeria arxii CBS 175.79]KAF2015064.1 longevity assurance proteins LAG1/LAC1 [Aaosphaeria arxii CBS 175.79]
MAQSDLEPFPPLSPQPVPQKGKKSSGNVRRRKSSGLGGELPGDSDVAAFATLSTRPQTPSTPTESSYSSKSGRRSKRRTVKRSLVRFKRLCFKHTWILPLLLTSIIVSLYLVYPYPSNPISACLFLSYPLPQEAGSDAPIQYGKGARDFAFVGFYTIVLSFTREFIMQRIIRPIALSYGIKSRAKQARFLEQFYTAVYFSLFGPFGMWVMSRTPVWYFNTTGMYEGFPHYTHEAVFKAYYLLQASYWAQQMIVLLLMLEAPRKDFKELVAHHFITLALIWCSYRFHFTYIGIAVYITMDISDFFLATSKVLNYIDHPWVGPYFAFFMCTWAYLRHWINLKILWSILTEFRTVGPYELNWETQQYKCWISQIITFVLLAAIQALNLIWWFYICRIAYRFAVTNVAEDERSEYEESEEENEDGETTKQDKKKANGKVNGSVPETPKVTLNGKTIHTPEKPIETEEPGSIASRLRERKSKK